jgi:hypothetical protein
MHSARLSSSDRLKRVADVLGDGQPHTTLEIVHAAGVCAVNSCVSELRRNGYSITCQRSGDVWFYRMNKWGAA